jgi:hypothetical protein
MFLNKRPYGRLTESSPVHYLSFYPYKIPKRRWVFCVASVGVICWGDFPEPMFALLGRALREPFATKLGMIDAQVIRTNY